MKKFKLVKNGKTIKGQYISLTPIHYGITLMYTLIYKDLETLKVETIDLSKSALLKIEVEE